jgi:GTPase-activator protein for Ras-like GTPase
VARKFVQSMIEQDVLQASKIKLTTEEPQTLFRGNSMGSKALDLYMKFVGLGIVMLTKDFLRSTLEGIIKVILLNKTSCEVRRALIELDPLRLQEGDGEDSTEKVHGAEAIQQAVNKHAAVLQDYVNLIVDNIFKNADQLPM